MNVTEKLKLWGVTHAQARAAEQAAAQQQGAPEDLQRSARQLRERANRLHGEIYSELDGGRRGRERPSG